MNNETRDDLILYRLDELKSFQTDHGQKLEELRLSVEHRMTKVETRINLRASLAGGIGAGLAALLLFLSKKFGVEL